jgi:hypothetical protein
MWYAGLGELLWPWCLLLSVVGGGGVLGPGLGGGRDARGGRACDMW